AVGHGLLFAVAIQHLSESGFRRVHHLSIREPVPVAANRFPNSMRSPFDVVNVCRTSRLARSGQEASDLDGFCPDCGHLDPGYGWTDHGSGGLGSWPGNLAGG